MTPKERIEAFYAGEAYDRVPTAIFMSDHIADLIGVKASALHLSAKINAEAQIAGYRTYGVEEVGPVFGVGAIAEALGTKLVFPDSSTPYIEKHLIADVNDIERIDIPSFHRAGRFSMFLEIAERLLDSVGDEVPVVFSIPGPFTTAGSLRGMENFMRDLYHRPAFAHRLLSLSLEGTLLFVREAGKLGLRYSIGEPTASGSLISLTHFREFAFPYLKELVSQIRSYGCGISSLHICGNTRKIWGDMIKTGVNVLSLDECIDLSEAKDEIGDKAALMGNIPPTDTMLLGTPQDVEHAVRECINKIYDSAGGFILGLGCGLPKNAAPENIRAFYEAAEKYGQYPLTPS